VIAQIVTCGFIDRGQNVVFQGFAGWGKTYLGRALAKRACQHRIRAHYIRMPDLEEAWRKPGRRRRINRWARRSC
jgi:DNA replication protein DnaC